jgi:hypothetical protein
VQCGMISLTILFLFIFFLDQYVVENLRVSKQIHTGAIAATKTKMVDCLKDTCFMLILY